MNKTRIPWIHAGLAVFAVLTSAFAGDSLDFGQNWNELPARFLEKSPPNWQLNSKYNPGSARLVSGKEGVVLQLDAPDSDEKELHLYFREPFPAVTGDVILVKVAARGKGELGVRAYPYDADGKSVSTRDPFPPRQAVTDDFAEYEFTVPVPKPTNATTGQIRIALAVSPSSSIQVKSLSATREN
jgi:hypothetical protein